jgi:D-alanyl-D-alanine carboxypeptidase
MLLAMEGVQSTLARISQLQARFATLAPASAVRSASTTRSTGAGASAGTTFADSLDRVSTTGSTATADAPLTPARRLAAGQYGTLQPPAELAAYGNGRIPEGRLAAIDGHGHQLWAPAATAFNQMSAAARRDGVTIGVNDSYRSLAGQQKVAQDKGLYSQGGLAAAPGTSTHGWGVSLDLQLDGRAQAWMRENGDRFGYVEDVAREPWHWTYRPGS